MFILNHYSQAALGSFMDDSQKGSIQNIEPQYIYIYIYIYIYMEEVIREVSCPYYVDN
jgi:hypothetical protein